MIYTDVKTISWANQERSAVNAIVTFDGFGDLPFTASPDDSEEHGVQIYNECINGDYGPIGDFQP